MIPFRALFSILFEYFKREIELKNGHLLLFIFLFSPERKRIDNWSRFSPNFWVKFLFQWICRSEIILFLFLFSLTLERDITGFLSCRHVSCIEFVCTTRRYIFMHWVHVSFAFGQVQVESMAKGDKRERKERRNRTEKELDSSGMLGNGQTPTRRGVVVPGLWDAQHHTERERERKTILP